MKTKEEDGFRSTPWCATLIDDPAFSLIPTSTGANNFWDTIACHGNVLRRIILNRFPDQDSGPTSAQTILLLEVSDGVRGQRNLCHGGFLATLLDEVAGVSLKLNGFSGNLSPLTAYMNISYKQPVFAPGVIVAIAQLQKIEGSKLYIRATIGDSIESIGTSADMMFVRRKESI